MSARKARIAASIAALLVAAVTIGLAAAMTPTAPSFASGTVGVPVSGPAVPANLTSTTLPTESTIDASEVLVEPPPEHFDAPVEAAPVLDLAALPPADAAPGGTWALTIGINDYPGGGHDLRSAVNDASDVRAALTAIGVPANRTVALQDRTASAASIRTAVRWLTERADQDATVVLFYAGHVRSLGGGTEAIVAADGETITDVELADLLLPLRAQRAWIVIAACYGGGFTEVLAPGRILTAAAPAGHVAYENLRFGRSYLVEYLVRRAVLGGEAPTSVEAAFQWAATAIGHEFPARVPIQVDQLDGELPLLAQGAATAPSASTTGSGRPPASPPPPAGSAPTTTTTAPPSGDSWADDHRNDDHDGDGCSGVFNSLCS